MTRHRHADPRLLPALPDAVASPRRRLLLTAAVALGSGRQVLGQVSTSSAASAPTTAADAPLVLATSTPGGGFALYGQTLADIINRQSGRAMLQARPSRGTEENLTLLRDRHVDAALIQGTSAGEILQAGESQPLRILFAMYPSPGLLAVPAASPAKRFEDLIGQPIVFGVRSSGLVTLARQVFGGLDLDIDKDFQARYVNRAADAPPLVLSGQARGLWGAGEGWPGFLTLSQSPAKARFLAPSPVQIRRILARYPLLKAMEVAPGAYDGITAPLPTVGSVNLILVHRDLPEDRAASLLNALEAAGAELGDALPQGRFSTRANTLASAPSPALLHAVLQR